MSLKDLPGDILRLAALDYLTGPEIISLCNLQRNFNHAICSQPEVWRKLYKRDLSSIRKEENYKQAYLKAYKYLPRRREAKYVYAAEEGYEKLLPVPEELARRITYGDLENILYQLGIHGYGSYMLKFLDSLPKTGNPAAFTAIFKAIEGAARGNHSELVRVLRSRLGPKDDFMADNAVLVGAAGSGDVETVRAMLERGADNYQRALVAGVDHAAVLELLVNRAGAGPSGYSLILYNAVKNGNLKSTKILVENANTRVRVQHVEDAAAQGNIPLTRYLLQRLPHYEYTRALMSARKLAADGNHADLLNYLDSNKGDPENRFSAVTLK